MKTTTTHGKRSFGPVSERREHLVRLAAGLFAEKGFQATTVRDIAREAGILSGSLYHHFDSKESIVDEILSGFLDEVMTAYRRVVEAHRDPRETLAELIRAACDALEPHRAAITVMQNDWCRLQAMERFAYLTEAEAEAEALWVGTIREGQRAGLFRADVDAGLTYLMLRDSIWASVRRRRADTRGLADHCLKVMFDGLVVP
ncbi:TetR/AcrR family transcriptional regulator [Thermomonospora umbrina]|uniref:TetR/AcrR family transcriptional regulator n=1 Tax=Thermomonospora umbrina TaxID=111806 RepID=UPI001FEC4B7E|nr:TetR/AcrR family transcriptional regulator [Thermomonospora umbrina]